jgi:hypothetical protein
MTSSPGWRKGNTEKPALQNAQIGHFLVIV